MTYYSLLVPINKVMIAVLIMNITICERYSRFSEDEGNGKSVTS